MNSTEIQMIIREFENLYCNKVVNPIVLDQFLNSCDLSKWNKTQTSERIKMSKKIDITMKTPALNRLLPNSNRPLKKS